MGNEKFARTSGRAAATGPFPSICPFPDDRGIADLLRERQALQRIEGLLQAHAVAGSRPADGPHETKAAVSSFREEEESFLLADATVTERRSPASLLSRCSPFDAERALESLRLLREGFDSQQNNSTHEKPGISTFLHAILTCISKEITGKEETVRSTSIASGMALLFALLIDQVVPQEGAKRHAVLHEDAGLMHLFFQVLEKVRHLSCPRPILLLLGALRQIYGQSHPRQAASPVGFREDQKTGGCACCPSRCVWAVLLQLFTEESRASVRWQARQTALHLLQTTATRARYEASQEECEQKSHSTVHEMQQKAMTSLGTCLTILDRWLRRLDFSVVKEAATPEVPGSSCTKGIPSASVRLQRSLPFFHRCLPSLLFFPARTASSLLPETSRGHTDEDRYRTRTTAESICLQLAFLSRRAGRTDAAADALRCIAAVLEHIRRQQRRERNEGSLHFSAPGGKEEGSESTSMLKTGEHGFPQSCVQSSALALTVQLLPALLQQQRKQGDQKGMWEELSGHSGAGSVQYAVAWCTAVSATLCALMQWAGGGREAWKPPQSSRSTASEVAREDRAAEDEGDEMLLLQQLQKLSLEHRVGTETSDSGPAGKSLASSRRMEICMQAVDRVTLSLREILDTQTDPSVLGAAAAAGRRIIEEAGASCIPAFPALVAFGLALLHFRHKRRLREGLQVASVLFAAFEAVASQQFLDCTLHPELDIHRRKPRTSGVDSSLRNTHDGECLGNFLEAFRLMYFPCFLPLLRQVVDMTAVVETGAKPQRDENGGHQDVTGKLSCQDMARVHSTIAQTVKAASTATVHEQRDLLVYRSYIRACFSAALRAFKAKTLLTDSRLLPMQLPSLASTTQERASFLLSSEFEQYLVTNAWALPLLAGALSRDHLGFFVSHFLPMAKLLQQKTAEKAKTHPVEARELCRLFQQVWGLLPGFADEPLDLQEAVRANDYALMKTMLQLLHDPVLREEICAAIRNLSAAAVNERAVEDARRDYHRERDSSEMPESGSQNPADVETDDVESSARSVVRVARGDGARRALEGCGAHVMGFLVVRFLQIHKISLKKSACEDTAGERTLAAMLLGQKEDLGQLTQSAKMKAAQHFLGAVKAFAPLCPPDLLHANARRFTSAFLRRATRAAGLAEVTGDGAPGGAESDTQQPALMGASECSALVDVADALFPFLSCDVGHEVFGSLRRLLSVCSRGLQKLDGLQGGSGGGVSEHDRHLLQVLMRRGYKALKHALEQSVAVPPGPEGQPPSRTVKETGKHRAEGVLRIPSLRLEKKDLEAVWEDLAAARSASCGTATEKPRLGCLRAFVEAGTNAVGSSGVLEGGSGNELQNTCFPSWEDFLLEQVFPALVPEILLSLKDANRLVRQTALDTLSSVSEACRGDRQKLSRLAVLIATGLGGSSGVPARPGEAAEPPLLKAAAILALSRLVFSYSAVVVRGATDDHGFCLPRSFTDADMGPDLVKELAELVFLLLRDADKQVFLAALRFARVIAHTLEGQELEQFVAPVLEMSLRSQHAVRAKMKIRRLVEKLIKKLGEASVRAAFPSEHLPLFRYLERSIRKQQLRSLLVTKALQEGLSWDELDFGGREDRSGRKNDGRGSSAGEKNDERGRKGDNFDEMMKEDDEEDEEEEELQRESKSRKQRRREEEVETEPEEESAAEERKLDRRLASSHVQQLLDAFEEEDDDEVAGGRRRKRKQRSNDRGSATSGDVLVLEDGDGELPLDFLSPAAAQRVIVNNPLCKHRRRIVGDTDGDEQVPRLRWNCDGRLVIPEDEDEATESRGCFTIGKASGAAAAGVRRPGSAATTLEHKHLAGKSVKVGNRPTLSCLAARRAAQKAVKPSKTQGHIIQRSGEEFRSKKAKGDVKRNNKVEPFAYVRLNRTMLREKHRPQALQSLARIVKKKRSTKEARKAVGQLVGKGKRIGDKRSRR
ncbi:nuc173 domain protein [Cystoisospora suis]|uniref:Nuc173 domain protein n=1 Tax=Cystoisospora suis TaxID=483139 RepID=A0A2C6LG59_9APIC|nr:nuc173 domain protein [Cystoisospora suis]